VGERETSPSSIEELTKQSCQDAIRLTLNFSLVEQQDVKWEALLWRENLFILIPDGISLDGSKEAFVALLEFAEEELRCKLVTVYFGKDRGDRSKGVSLLTCLSINLFLPTVITFLTFIFFSLLNDYLIRLFMFLGFVTLPPTILWFPLTRPIICSTCLTIGG